MEANKLSVKALAVTSALLWSAALFMVGTINLFRPDYGKSFLGLMSSVYPLYDGAASLKSIFMLVLHGMFDGALCGIAFALLYNLLLSPAKK